MSILISTSICLSSARVGSTGVFVGTLISQDIHQVQCRTVAKQAVLVLGLLDQTLCIYCADMFR